MNDKLPLQCIGVALRVTVGLLEVTYPNTGTCIMLFSGPATEGPGMVHYKCAVKFYEGFMKWASNSGHVVDLFAGCLDQVRSLEMKSLPNSTNSVIVLSDSFLTSIFQQRFLHIFNKDNEDFLEMGFDAMFGLQVFFSPSINFTHVANGHWVDHQGAGSLWIYRACHLSKKGIHLCWRDANQYQADLCIETELSIAASFDQEAAILMVRKAVLKAEINSIYVSLMKKSISIKPDIILLLDTLFHNLISHREMVAQWGKPDTEIKQVAKISSNSWRHLLLMHRIFSLTVVGRGASLPVFGRVLAYDSHEHQLLSQIADEFIDSSNIAPPTPTMMGKGNLKQGELSKEEQKSILTAPEFLDFMEQSSKTIQQSAQNQTGRSSFTSCNLEVDPHVTEMIWRNHSITDTDWSLKYPELSVTSYNKNPAALTEPDGIIAIWNLHLLEWPKFIFHSQLWQAKSPVKPLMTAQTIPPIYSFNEVDNYVYDVEWHPAHPTIFGTASNSGKFELWNLNNTGVSAVTTDIGMGHTINKLEWDHKDGQHVALDCSDRKLYIYNILAA
ncbi:hypothetical protein BKA83DRAFT_4125408 [Pisolithus microcarpus]|nr:hypothetical protein BKA83DRAFT_4125408 [Pisolithus microcarpus]